MMSPVTGGCKVARVTHGRKLRVILIQAVGDQAIAMKARAARQSIIGSD